MEWKIGEIKQINGEWYQCVEGLYCDDCAFVNDNCGDRERITLREKLTKQPTTGFCNSEKRNDKTSVIFKKLEKVGEPYLFQERTFQTYNVFIEPSVSEDIGLIIIPSKNINTVEIEIKQNKEDMEEGKLDPHMEKVIDEAAQKLGDEISKQLKENLNKQRMKPFDLQKAKAGKPVCTRDGRKARIICFDRKSHSPIIALVETFVKEYNSVREDTYYYTINGRAIDIENESKDDLMMLPEKKEGWVKIRKDINLYDTKEEADRKMIGNDEYVTAKVCWEE